jgi:hypothetical protein
MSVPDLPNPPNPKRRWYQYRLRTLMIAVTLAAVGASWFAVKMQRARRQRELVEMVRKIGGFEEYEYERDAEGEFLPNAEPHGPLWLNRLLGVDFFNHVIFLGVTITKGADVARIGELTRLRRLNLSGKEITDSGLAHIKTLTQLYYLSIIDSGVTNNGLQHLQGLSHLSFLIIENAKITDAGLEQLKGMTQLRTLFLGETKVTDEGIKVLQKALPDCEIMRW